MASAFTGCSVNNTNSGCPFNPAKGESGCPSSTCCRVKSADVVQAEQWRADIARCQVELRVLRNEFRKRTTSKCSDTSEVVTKAQFEKEKAKLEAKIARRTQQINNQRKKKQGRRLLRENPVKSFCSSSPATLTKVGCSCS